MNKHIAAAALLLAAACSQHSPAPENQTAPSPKPPAPPPKQAPVSTAKAASAPSTVDPNSTDAAIALVQGFADLLNAGKLDQAYMLLGPGAPPRAEFDRRFASIAHINVEVSNPGPQEGAAGSIYVSVPIEIVGDEVRNSATLVVRRVNDVPGSTRAQRHWHIERIDWGMGA